MNNNKIATWFGEFSRNERVTVQVTGLLGEVTTIKGRVVGKRYSRGTEYLMIECKKKRIHEVPLRSGGIDFVREDMSIAEDDDDMGVESETTNSMAEFAMEEPMAEPVQSRYSRVR